jgi:hypothetical protein
MGAQHPNTARVRAPPWRLGDHSRFATKTQERDVGRAQNFAGTSAHVTRRCMSSLGTNGAPGDELHLAAAAPTLPCVRPTETSALRATAPICAERERRALRLTNTHVGKALCASGAQNGRQMSAHDHERQAVRAHHGGPGATAGACPQRGNGTSVFSQTLQKALRTSRAHGRQLRGEGGAAGEELHLATAAPTSPCLCRAPAAPTRKSAAAHRRAPHLRRLGAGQRKEQIARVSAHRTAPRTTRA